MSDAFREEKIGHKSTKTSCGILLFRRTSGETEFFLAHPGGPLFVKKDEGYWSIPKGEIELGEENYLGTALREFHEETGFEALPPFIELGFVTQKSGKKVYCWASEYFGEGNPFIKSNTFMFEYPYKSGKFQEIPEIDRADFFRADEAKVKIKERQTELIDRLIGYLSVSF